MQQIKKYHLDRYEYAVYLDDSHGVSTDFYIRDVLIAKCHCCSRKVVNSNFSYWIVCRDPIGYPPDDTRAGKQLLLCTLQHGPFTEQEAQDFMDKRIQRVERLKREGD